ISLTFFLIVAMQLPAQNAFLDKAIQKALANNWVIKQKNVSLEKALAVIQQAKANYLPNVAFQLGYQTGEGGRAIQIPVGDLMNPVYRTLNQLTSSNAFPTISNVNQSFFPNNLYDAKISVTAPIYNENIKYNIQIQQQQRQLLSFEKELYERELVKEIKQAYFQYLSALQLVSIYQSSLQLATVAKNNYEKLLSSGKGLPVYVIRANSEIASLEAKLNEAQLQAKNANLYFNFLSNEEAETTINTQFNEQEWLAGIQANLLQGIAVNGREELRMLQKAGEVQQTVVTMYKNFWKPQLNAFWSAGAQGERWKMNNRSWYYIGGLQLDIPIYSGKRNQLKIKQSNFDFQQTQMQQQYVQSQLNLAASVAQNNLLSSIKNYKAALQQTEAAASYERLIQRGFAEGVNTYIETVDARNQFTIAQLQLSLNLYKIFINHSILERETAQYRLPK
ncbi:MAG: TolC family protein, partial [Chitinophagaceae bacterium]